MLWEVDCYLEVGKITKLIKNHLRDKKMNLAGAQEPILGSDESDRESPLSLAEARDRSQQILEALIENDIIKRTPEDKRRISVGLQGSVV